MVQVIERKGLDIVRRDWSLLAKDLGDFCLTQILSGGYVTIAHSGYSGCNIYSFMWQLNIALCLQVM